MMNVLTDVLAKDETGPVIIFAQAVPLINPCFNSFIFQKSILRI